jgi:hypothetical protein
MTRCKRCSYPSCASGFGKFCFQHVKEIYATIANYKDINCHLIKNGCASNTPRYLSEKYAKFRWLKKSNVTYDIYDDGHLKLNKYCAFCYMYMDDIKAEIKSIEDEKK